MSPQHAPYDPVKAHQYYEEHKNLTGRKPPTPRDHTPHPGTKPHVNPALVARVNRLKAKVSTLVHALSTAEAELSSRRQKATKTKAANSDGKATAAQKKASQQYRDKNKTKLAAKAKKSASSSGGSSSSSSSSNSVSSMSTEALGARVIKIKSALADARSQLSSATQQLGQLTHSAIASDPQANAHFAQFRSERIPS